MEQNNQYNQYNQIYIPQMEEKPHKNTKIVVAVVLACVVVFAAMAVAGVMVVRAYNSDERKFMKGFMNLAEEINERRQLWETATGESLTEGGGSTQTEMTFNLSSDEFPVTIGLDMSFLKDNDVRKIRNEAVLSVMNSDLIGYTIYGDNKRIILSVPEIWRQNFEFSPSQIDRQYNESLLAEKFGTIDSEEISIDFFEENEDDLSSNVLKEWLEEVLEFSQNMKNSTTGSVQGISIENPEGTVTISFPEKDDKEYECREYRMTISKEWIESTQDAKVTVNTTGVEVTTAISSDFVLLIDMDKNNRIIRIASEKPVQFLVESDEFSGFAGYSMSVGFLGEKRSIDDIYVNIDIDYTLDMTDWYSGEEKFLIQFDSQIGYDENDACVTVDIDKLEISNDTIGTLKMTGKIDMEPLKEKIQPLEGETIQLFRITEEEYEDLENQLNETIMKWMNILSLMY
ncbi:MAG: hypothetical protein K2K21_13830 [Lachnospiraceae bacterium]|nr:hypothetical protein [Lachnospiraceae bacterium]